MKIFLILLSFMSVGVGVIGIILPILPTTPFFLLALYLSSKSSKRMNDWITGSTIYKKHIQSFHEDKSMTFKQKWFLLITVDVMLIVTFIQIDSIALRVLIILLIGYKHYYFKRYIKVLRG